MDHNTLPEGWKKYLESMEKRLDKIDATVETRFNQLDKKIDPLIAFRNQMIGRGVIIAGLVGFVTTGIIQIAIAFYQAKF